ncbi:hypothetical protein ACEWYG_00205 [Helicobacter pylori]|uniref:hypothetical protein n=1 Tax=Helicobacter pylori TaxID=210 RepID=UPI0035A95B66
MNTFASTEYTSLLQILSFGVISQKSEFFVKNGLNKLFYVLKLYLYVDFMKLLRCFCGKNLEHVKFGSMLGFLVVAGGYLKKRCFIALFYRFSNGLIQTGFGRGRLKG